MPSRFVTAQQLAALARGQTGPIPIGAQASSAGQGPQHCRAILAGAFNPLHQGHQQMARVAERQLSVPVAFEISIANVDKAHPTVADLNRRLSQFTEHQVVWVTCADTFVKKAALFRRAYFVVGVDTIQRIADVRYYGHRRGQRDDAIEQILDSGCRFLVFGRLHADRFLQLENCELPARLLEICESVPASVFRHDISSRELRQLAGE